MKRLGIWLAVATCALAIARGANAAIVLDFEGVGDLATVGEFYNGGAGTNYGISFSGNALAVVDADAGGSGNIGGEPSPDTALFFLDGPAATMNVAAGFDTGFSFFYSAVNESGFVSVWDGLNGTGNLLATILLAVTPSDGGDPNGPFSPFLPIGVSFSGIAKSVDFGGSVNQIAFDDITLGSETPGNIIVPEPGSVAVWTLLGLTFAGSAWRRRKATK